MLSDVNFVTQTLTSNLYFLRTLREFATNIQLSFLDKNQEYIDTARDFGTRSEELGRVLIKYASSNVPVAAVNSNIFVTPYTLDAELLTEKLFNIDIDTTITEEETNIVGGVSNNVTPMMINDLMMVNKEALVLVTNFIDFCKDIIDKMQNNELFSYSYISLIEAMLVEMELYKSNLNRLIARESIDPGFVVNYEYLFNNLLSKLSSFVRGLVDPKNDIMIVRASAFANEFSLLANDYKNAIANPENYQELQKNTLDALNRFISFIINAITDVLDSNVYFIVEPIFLDNMLTTANYFKYIISMNS